jgi:enterochelin esterase family protein
VAKQEAMAICLLLDGEYYVHKMDAPAVVAQLQNERQIPPLAVVYVSHIDGQTRWRETFCNEHFACSIAEEFLPWAKENAGAAQEDPPIILGGLSLTGLAAAHAGLLFPKHFKGILCQSASFWWSENWLSQTLGHPGPRLPAFRISCGKSETKEHVDHGEGLIQRTSQIVSNRMMRDALRDQNCRLSYAEFEGGHDIASWKADLPHSLIWLMSQSV